MTRDPYHIETSSLICSANQWIGCYIIKTSVKKEFIGKLKRIKSHSPFNYHLTKKFFFFIFFTFRQNMMIFYTNIHTNNKMRQLTSYKVLLLSFLKTVPSWVMTMTLNTILNKIKSGDLHFFVISKDLHITKR